MVENKADRVVQTHDVSCAELPQRRLRRWRFVTSVSLVRGPISPLAPVSTAFLGSDNSNFLDAVWKSEHKLTGKKQQQKPYLMVPLRVPAVVPEATTTWLVS